MIKFKHLFHIICQNHTFCRRANISTGLKIPLMMIGALCVLSPSCFYITASTPENSVSATPQLTIVIEGKSAFMLVDQLV